MFLHSNLRGCGRGHLDTCEGWMFSDVQGNKRTLKSTLFFLSSEIIYDAHVHVIPRLRQSLKEMCRLIISYQILMDQFGQRNPFWRLSHITYVRFLYRICLSMFM